MIEDITQRLTFFFLRFVIPFVSAQLFPVPQRFFNVLRWPVCDEYWDVSATQVMTTAKEEYLVDL